MNETDDTFEERAQRLFGDVTIRLQVAALPWRRSFNGSEVLLITSRDTGRWVLPKGWVEKDEKPWRAAEREAVEEAGVSGEVGREPIGRYLYAKVQKMGRAKACEVHVYPLAVAKIADDWRERDQRERRWFCPQDASSRVDEPDLAELIQRFGRNSVGATVE